jgi:Fe-Mn family superoxide dismutase
MPVENYKFELKPLPYEYNALEPYIDKETMHFHHDKHLKTYVDNLNKSLENYPCYQKWSLKELVKYYKRLPMQLQTPIKNNAGGVYNHNLFFELLSPESKLDMSSNLVKRIEKDFGSFENFKNQFKNIALSVFGSGYAWLVKDMHGKLSIITTANQDTPLPLKLCPILLIDVWEHAYYLKNQNRRNEYIDSWFNIINWGKAEERYLNGCLQI